MQSSRSDFIKLLLDASKAGVHSKNDSDLVANDDVTDENQSENINTDVTTQGSQSESRECDITKHGSQSESQDDKNKENFDNEVSDRVKLKDESCPKQNLSKKELVGLDYIREHMNHDNKMEAAIFDKKVSNNIDLTLDTASLKRKLLEWEESQQYETNEKTDETKQENSEEKPNATATKTEEKCTLTKEVSLNWSDLIYQNQ